MPPAKDGFSSSFTGLRFSSAFPLEAAKVPRPMILYCRKHFEGRTDLVGIEIGVSKGVNAKSILDTLSMKKLYLIDPYLPYVDWCGRTEPGGARAAAHKLLDKDPRVEWIEKTSKEATERFNGVHVDFVYIDGNHMYSHVYQDMNLYYPLVKENGVLGGHDFTIINLGVRDAVHDYATVNQIDFYAEYPDWWFRPKRG